MDYNDRSCAGNALHNKAHSAIWVLSSEPNTPHRHLQDWLLCSSGVSRNWGIYAACLFQVDLVSLSINMGRCNMAACCVSMNITPECSQVVSYKSSSCIKTSTRIQLSYWACKRLLFQSDMTWYLSILLHRRYSFSSRRWPPILFPCHLFAAKSVDMPSITRCVNNCEAQLAKEWRLHVYPVFCLELANFCFCLLVNRIDKNLRGSIQESRA